MFEEKKPQREFRVGEYVAIKGLKQEIGKVMSLGHNMVYVRNEHGSIEPYLREELEFVDLGL